MSHTMTANDYELEWKHGGVGLGAGCFLLSNSWWVMVINDSSCYLAPLTPRELHTTNVGMGFHSTKKNESLSFLFFNLAIYSERGLSCASPLLYSAVIHLKTAHYSSHLLGRENADFNRLSRKPLRQINEQHGWEVGGRRDGRNREHWQKGGVKGKSWVRWRWPTLNLFVCMVWFQKLCRKKQIILKINEYVHTCKTCTGNWVWQDVKNKMDRWATCTRREIQSSRVRKQSYSLFVTARRDVQQDSWDFDSYNGLRVYSLRPALLFVFSLSRQSDASNVEHFLQN